MAAKVVVSISYGEQTNANYTRTTHLISFDDVVADEAKAKAIADAIIKILVDDSGGFGVYKEEFPNTINPNPLVN